MDIKPHYYYVALVYVLYVYRFEFGVYVCVVKVKSFEILKKN